MLLPFAIRAHFKESVSFLIPSSAGTDAYGVAASPTTTTQLCRIEYSQKRLTSVNGQERFSTVQIYTEDIPTLTADARVTLPSGETRQIAAMNRRRWPNGASHIEVFV